MSRVVHTESRRRFRLQWVSAGGRIEDVRRTGEERYFHALFPRPVTANKTRKDVPAKLLSCLNQIARAQIGGIDPPVEKPTIHAHN